MRTKNSGFLINICIALMIILSGAALVSATTPTAHADAGPDKEVDVNTVVTLDGSGSSGAGTLEFTWYFRDGTVATLTNPIVTHTYTTEGVYDVGLLVEDGNGYFDFDIVRITVKNYYPVADAGSDLTANEDDVIAFDGTGSSDLNNDIVSYEWDFDDGTTASGATATKSYENAGTYHVTLTVTDNDGAYDIDTRTMTILNVDPNADGVADSELDDDLMVYEDDLINFDASLSTDTSSDAPHLKYAWDFDDGSKGYGITTSHTYTKKGVYQTTLRVTDDNDAYTEDVITINVLNAAPIADSGPDQTVQEGDTVLFDAVASSDLPSDDPLLDYSWDLPNQGTNPTHLWYDDSTNDVELLLTDDDSASGADTTTISVLNTPPEANVHAAYIPVEFTLRQAGKKGFDIRLEHFEGSMVTDYLETTRVPGNPDDQSQEMLVNINIAETSLVKVYFTPLDDQVKGKTKGAAPVWVTLSFEDGTETKLFRSFNVNKPAEWVWEIDMGEHLVGHAVHFEGSVYDPGSDDMTVTWDFGDGTIISNHYPNSGDHPVRIDESVEHIFKKKGLLTMTFSAEDDDGGLGTDTIMVDSQKDSIYIDNVVPTASASSDKNSVVEDEVIDFSGIGSDTSSDIGILVYHWDFGDGNTASTADASHSYEHQGVYNVLLTVTDDSGESGVDHLEIQVHNVQPVAVLSADDTDINEDDTVNFDASSSTDTTRDIPKLVYAWDFGDGSKGYGITTSHLYTNCGVYTVVLTVQDDNGAVDTDSIQITVNNVDPYNVNIVAKTSVVEDEVIFFTGSASDTPSDEVLLAYDWDFGDSTSGQGTNPTHTYSSLGLYTVELTVTDDDGSSTSTSIQISVSNVDPVAYAAPSSMILYGPKMTIKFEGRGFDTFFDQSSLVFKWNLGGGIIQYTQDVTMTFSATGTYDISLVVYDYHSAMSNKEEIQIEFTLDTDGDMVTDEYEAVVGTNINLWDTDSDNLMDYFEVYVYPTDPLVADTDSDNLNDWHEITHFGVSDPDEDSLSNPCDWDSDGEWIIDSLDTHPLQYNDVDGSQLFWDAIKVANNVGLGVSAVMYGGTCFTSPTISAATPPAPVSAGVGIYFSVSSSCTPPFSSQIRVRYDDTALPSGTSESNLALYYYSTSDAMWKIAGVTGADTTHNFVWAKVTHFSVFAVVDISKMDSDNDGLKDLYEISNYYSFTHSGSQYKPYSSGNLYIKNNRLQVQIPSSSIFKVGIVSYGTVNLFTMGYNAGDFTSTNTWKLTDGGSKTYVSVVTKPLINVQSASASFALYSMIGSNVLEITTTSQTDPYDADTDNDGLTDGKEVTQYYTNPIDPDHDNDGLSDGAEVNTRYTNPKDSDTDNDGTKDGSDLDPLVNLHVYVRIQEILQSADWVDGWLFEKGEFYIKVAVNGVWKQSSVLGNNDAHHKPNLLYGWDVPDSSQYVYVDFELWDNDPWPNPDDQVDISRSGDRLDVTYNVKTGMWTGEDYYLDRNGMGHASGSEDGSMGWDDDDCEIWFDIYQNGYDADRLPYWQEVFDLGTNPKVTNYDSDSDGMPDWWEVRYGLNRVNSGDANSDADSDRVTNKREYQIGTNPRFFEISMTVSLGFDASTGYINDYKYGMKKASDYLYDVTDGYLYFRYIEIRENSGGWSTADIQVHSGTADDKNDHHWPKASVGGITSTSYHITMPQYFDHDGWFGGSGPNKDEYYKTIAHEFGHYGLHLYDEYLDKNGKEYGFNWLGNPKGPPSMMNSQYKVSEMSSKGTYDSWSPPSGFETTMQYDYNDGPCWKTFYEKYKDKLWFDLDNNGVRDTSFKTNYSPIGGPGVMVDGPYVIFG
ncbi:MAG: PKD domain-containing protein [Thermoplasmata archaeon]|nr:MAG: PKD domain-containing protein [Thermoplasmata archaeon]